MHLTIRLETRFQRGKSADDSPAAFRPIGRLMGPNRAGIDQNAPITSCFSTDQFSPDFQGDPA